LGGPFSSAMFRNPLIFNQLCVVAKKRTRAEKPDGSGSDHDLFA